MHIRDRIRELRRVSAGQLRPNPRNWRTHPPSQRAALQGLLAEIGYADALLARELPDGTLELIDGHLRAELTPQAEVPVLVLDLDPREADKLLALLDPLAALAETDGAKLTALLAGLDTRSAAVQIVVDDLAARAAASLGGEVADADPPEVDVPRLFQLVVECANEAEQRALFERLRGEGRKVRLLNL